MSSKVRVPRIVGSTIVGVREITPQEAEQMGMDNGDDGNRLVVILNTGTKLVAWRDPEGNGLGHLVASHKNAIYDVMPDTRMVPVPVPLTKPQAIAEEFVRRLRSALSKEEMDQVRARNMAETNPGICHSHDFCDANVYMAEAFEKVVGREVLLPCNTGNTEESEAALQADCDLMNEAWSLAKPKF